MEKITKGQRYISLYAFYAKYINKDISKREENYSFFGLPNMIYQVVNVNKDDYIVRLEEEHKKYEIELTIDMLVHMFKLEK